MTDSVFNKEVMTLFHFPDSINAENFDAVWKYTGRKYRTAKRMSVIRAVIYNTSEIVFLAAALIISYGILLQYAPGQFTAFIRRLPVLVDYWSRFQKVVFPAGLTDAEKLLRLAGLLYLVPIAAGMILSIPVLVLYHPVLFGKPEIATEQAQELKNRTVKIAVFNQRKPSMVGGFCCVFYGMIAIALLVCFLLTQAKLPAVGYEITSAAPRLSFMLALSCIGFIIAYLLLSFPIRFLVKWIFTPRVPKRFTAICENYLHSVQKNEAASRQAAAAQTASEGENTNQ